MRTWVIATCSLINDPFVGRDYFTRKKEYQMGIPQIINAFPNSTILIVENHSSIAGKNLFIQKTFLDRYNVPVIYTTTNKIITKNYGMKELLDVQYCIAKYNIPDDDFVIKVTGRYVIKADSPFIAEVNKLETTGYDAILRYGSFEEEGCLEKKASCVTGLIGLRCKYIKEMELPDENTFVEDVWARKIMSLDDSKVCILKRLGIFIRPCAIKEYYEV